MSLRVLGAVRLKLGLPALAWISGYNERVLARDLTASGVLIASMMPQALAFAMVAGVPVQIGLYSAILPAVVYALLGTGRTLSVGPVAIVSILSATAIKEATATLNTGAVETMVTLTVLVGLCLTLLGLFRFGFIANFLSRPVVSGFISASGVVIAASQAHLLLGLPANGDTLPDILYNTFAAEGSVSSATLMLGAITIAFLVFARLIFIGLFDAFGVPRSFTYSSIKLLPLIALIGASYLGYLLGFEREGLAVLGKVPGGAPPLTMPLLNLSLWSALLPSAFLIAVIAYVESISTARKLAANRRERVSPDQELFGLGAANLISAFSSGLPVAGSLARSLANYDAGARTPLALIFAAWGVGIFTYFFTDILFHVPVAAVAAIVIVAVLGPVDIGMVIRAWRQSAADVGSLIGTIVVTLSFGVASGLLVGVALSVLVHNYRTSRPHAAIVGKLPGTDRFGDADRHDVVTDPLVCTIRIDESLYFPNAAFLEEVVYAAVAARPRMRHLVLMCSSVNAIDMSALETMEMLNYRLAELNITLNLSEVKPHVIDELRDSTFRSRMTGKIFPTQLEAFESLRRA